MVNALIFKESDLDEQIGDGLENALKNVKRIDRRVARTLTFRTGVLGKIPGVNKLAYGLNMVQP